MRNLVISCLLAVLAACSSRAPEIPIDPSRYDVKIERDRWGIPHIHGKTDADTAFGFAYAQAEDGWELIEETLPFYRGESARYNGADAAPADYMIQWLGVREWVNSGYDNQISPEARALVQAYADGLNHFAAKHPDRIERDILPVTTTDIVTGFVVRHLLFYGFDGAVKEVMGPKRAREMSRLVADLGLSDTPIGSNAIAVSPAATDDGVTRLMINSHQPTDGPVAWYEAHISSDEGLNIMGGTFPGSPLISLGFNHDIAWGVTVNKPDLVDIFVLEINPDNENQYRLDGQWLDLEVEDASLRVKLWGPLYWTFTRKIYRSKHGPVMKTDHGSYAFRFGGQNEIRQVDQWYAMNRARSFDEWYAAMAQHRFASFNFVFADKEGTIAFIHNSLTPLRESGYDWSQYLPGDQSNLIWDSYLPFEQLPQVVRPKHGYLASTNQTPFMVAHENDNPDPSAFSPTDGYQTRMTNRADRAFELFESLAPISADDFWAIKHDKAYASSSRAGRYIQAAIEAELPNALPHQLEAQTLLAEWDLVANIQSREAALGVCVIRAEWRAEQDGLAPPDAGGVLQTCADELLEVSGRIDPLWGDINRHIRGKINVPVGGGPDTLRAIYGMGYEENGYLTNIAGDGLYYLVAWDAQQKLSVQGVHHYGSATMLEDSSHFADQAENFAAERLHAPLFDEKERAAAGDVGSYRP
ncbi:MAG: penicillin acylase family protein [Halieaceae bacterium]|nr:penicillin acylase family protein [Halieaceae bacterium]